MCIKAQDFCFFINFFFFYYYHPRMQVDNNTDSNKVAVIDRWQIGVWCHSN